MRSRKPTAVVVEIEEQQLAAVTAPTRGGSTVL